MLRPLQYITMHRLFSCSRLVFSIALVRESSFFMYRIVLSKASRRPRRYSSYDILPPLFRYGPSFRHGGCADVAPGK